jgi:nucleotide-binding universal stress UspA family protein
MSAYRVILHPTDFSPASMNAFRAACDLAKSMNARLILLHVDEPVTVVIGEMYPMSSLPSGENEALMERLNSMGPIPPSVEVERYVIEGIATEEIVHFAKDHHCDLIVMGTLGRTGLGRLIMGSVAERVVRKAPCDVLTVKAPHAQIVPNEEEAMITAGL